MKDEYILGLAVALLIIGAVFVSSGVTIDVSELLFPSQAWVRAIVSISLPLALVLVASIVNRYVSSERLHRVVVWCLALVALVAGVGVVGADPLLSVILIATWLGAVLTVIDDDPCRLRVRQMVSRPKLIATLIILIFSIYYLAAYRDTLRDEFTQHIFDMLGSRSVNSSIPIDANVTPKEVEMLRQKLESFDWWQQLPQDQKDRIFKEQLKIYADTKKAVVDTLTGSLNLTPERLNSILQNEMQSIPIVKQTLDNIHYIAAFTVVVFYSFASLVAEILAWIVGAIITMLLGPVPGRKQLT